jgi:hypothetical protein
LNATVGAGSKVPLPGRSDLDGEAEDGIDVEIPARQIAPCPAGSLEGQAEPGGKHHQIAVDVLREPGTVLPSRWPHRVEASAMSLPR